MPRMGRWLKAVAIATIVVFFSADAVASIPRMPADPPALSKGKSSAKKTARKTAAGKTKNSSKRKKLARKSGRKRVGPESFVDNRAAKLYVDLMSRPPRMSVASRQEIRTAAQKSTWLSSIYARNLVDASPQTELLADKLIMFKILSQALGEEAHRYYPKTMGLKEFLDKHRLTNSKGVLKADGEAIEQALYKEFPAGFVVRPAVGVAPTETRKGLYPEGDAFVEALVKGAFTGYEPGHFLRPVKSHILGTVASGEAVVLQDDIILRAEAKKKLALRTFREVRIHTYENRVVQNAVPTRWVQEARASEQEIAKVERFIAEALERAPSRLLARQAWGIDVALFDNGEMIITDIVTNRGKRIQWSSYLEQPRVFGAYARHFEQHAGVKFEGVAGSLIRNNFGNYFSYWDARIEKSKPGWRKLLSYLPPVP